jgi:GT2 family glycosyltransferase
MTTASAAIIILNYNDGSNTLALAKKIENYSSFSKIILVDNCSTDDSFEKMNTAISDKIDVICTTENGGYAKGNNFGVSYAINKYSPDYLFIANPDIMVTDDVAEKIMNALQGNPDFGLISCLVNQGYNIWNLPGFIGILESLFLIWFNLHKRMIKKRLIASPHALKEIGVAEGSFFCIRRKAFETVGGLDERTFLYVEESILSKRLHNSGYKVGVLTKSYYDHFHSVTIKKEYKSSKARAFHHFHNSMKLYNKEYLHTNRVQDTLFEICYGFAYLERVLYDFLMSLF